jgi:hypothetical protein
MAGSYDSSNEEVRVLQAILICVRVVSINGCANSVMCKTAQAVSKITFAVLGIEENEKT